DFQARGGLVVANEQIRNPKRVRIQGAARRYSGLPASLASQVLNAGEKTCSENVQAHFSVHSDRACITSAHSFPRLTELNRRTTVEANMALTSRHGEFVRWRTILSLRERRMPV